MQKQYEVCLYKDPTKLILIWLFATFVTIGLFVYLGKRYDNLKWLSMIISSSVFLLPFLIGGSVRKNLMSKAILDFNDIEFSVTQYSLTTNEIIDKTTFLWEEMKFYRFYFDTKQNTCLTIYMKNGKKHLLIFKDNKTYDEAAKQDSVFFYFCSFVNRFNQDGQKIFLKPGILATNTGTYIILSQIALLVCAFVFHLVTNNFYNSYYLLLGVSFIIPQILNRVQNKALYKKILEDQRIRPQ